MRADGIQDIKDVGCFGIVCPVHLSIGRMRMHLSPIVRIQTALGGGARSGSRVSWRGHAAAAKPDGYAAYLES